MTSVSLNMLKAEWKAAKYTPPEDDTAHLLPEDHPDHEPFELSETYENQLGREVIEEGTFPSEHTFFKMMQDWCLKATLTDFEASEVWARALNEHHALVYSSAARLFYLSLTDAFEDKARRIGQDLDAAGGVPLMQLVYYGVSHATKMIVHELHDAENESDKMRALSAIYYMVSVAFNGVGDWQH